MTIPTIEYGGYELRAYSRQTYPPFGDPYAPGQKEFSAVVRIEPNAGQADAVRRYAAPLGGMHVQTEGDAAAAAMQYGKDIIDGKVHAQAILGLQ
jgi:hypothetical protein